MSWCGLVGAISLGERSPLSVYMSHPPPPKVSKSYHAYPNKHHLSQDEGCISWLHAPSMPSA